MITDDDSDSDIPISSSVCGTTCTTAADCDEDFFPWATCANITEEGPGLCGSDPNIELITNMTQWLGTCSDNSDCDYPSSWCIPLIDGGVDEFDGAIPEGLCVANDTMLISNATGITVCEDDDDCDANAPVCVNLTNSLAGFGSRLPFCRDDADCEGMGFEDGFCRVLTNDNGDEWDGYSTCITLDPCDLLSSASDCDSDQVCVNNLCFGACETDDDCSDDVVCEEVSVEIPFLGHQEFNYCNVLDTITTETPTMAPVTPAPVDTPAPVTAAPVPPEPTDSEGTPAPVTPAPVTP